MKIIDQVANAKIKKDLLFFITTGNEAGQLCKAIRPAHPKVFCIEVFADMPKDQKIYAESRDKFLELGNYDQKLIMATNVAESSLTIDGLKYVVDSGYELYSYFDPETTGNILEKRLITQAQALQRRGRVGRTEPGICYHLMTEEQFNQLVPYPTPDILRQDITLEMVKIMMLSQSKKLSEAMEALDELMDRPMREYTDYAISLIKNYNLIDNNEVLTKMGRDISNFSSLELNQSLFLLYSYQLHCAKEASIIMAMEEVLHGKLSNLFFKNVKATTLVTDCDTQGNGCLDVLPKDLIKKLIGGTLEKKSDHFTFLHIYQCFMEATDQRKWANKFNIKMDLLNVVSGLSKQYFYRVHSTSRAPQLDRVKDVDNNKRVLEALKLSHRHMTAKNLKPIFSSKPMSGSINRESVVYYHYKKNDLMKKSFIYGKYTSINGTWDYSMVTLI